MRIDSQVLAYLRGVHKAYAGHAALAGIDLELRSGQVLALLGANGAGKSTAVMVAAMVFALAISLVLAALALAFADVALRPGQWALLLLVNVAGVLPFCAVGLYIGSRVGASAAPAVVNLLYLPMGFLSGLWLPLAMLPDAIGWLAPVWPSYHLGELAQKVVGGGAGGDAWLHLCVLVAVTGAFVVLARARLARGG